MTEQAYYPLGKTLENQTKTIEEQGRKQAETLELLKPVKWQLINKDAIPEGQVNEEVVNEIEKIKIKNEKLVNRDRCRGMHL